LEIDYVVFVPIRTAHSTICPKYSVRLNDFVTIRILKQIHLDSHGVAKCGYFVVRFREDLSDLSQTDSEALMNVCRYLNIIKTIHRSALQDAFDKVADVLERFITALSLVC
jgi:hypothetical protein